MSLETIRTILQDFIDKIDSGNSNITEQEQLEIIDVLRRINEKELSKIQAAKYIGVCRATFDNYVSNGWIPKGHKTQGFKELSWSKVDLDKFLQKNG